MRLLFHNARQLLELFARKVRLLVFGVGVDKVTMLSPSPPVVNHSGPAAFAATREGYAQLAQAPASGDDVTGLWVCQQYFLKALQCFTVEQTGRHAREDRELDEDRSLNIR